MSSWQSTKQSSIFSISLKIHIFTFPGTTSHWPLPSPAAPDQQSPQQMRHLDFIAQFTSDIPSKGQPTLPQTPCPDWNLIISRSQLYQVWISRLWLRHRGRTPHYQTAPPHHSVSGRYPFQPQPPLSFAMMSLPVPPDHMYSPPPVYGGRLLTACILYPTLASEPDNISPPPGMSCQASTRMFINGLSNAYSASILRCNNTHARAGSFTPPDA